MATKTVKKTSGKVSDKPQSIIVKRLPEQRVSEFMTELAALFNKYVDIIAGDIKIPTTQCSASIRYHLHVLANPKGHKLKDKPKAKEVISK